MANEQVAFLKIGHVASILGVSTSRIRLWEHEGLIAPSRTEGGQRRYSQADLERMEEIRSLLDTKEVTFRGVRERLGEDDGSNSVTPLATSADPIGERVKLARRERGMSLRDLAGLTEISPSALSAFERGLSKPNTGRISTIAHALGVTVPDLLGMPRREDRMIVRADERERLATSEEGLVVELLYQTNTVLQSQAIHMEPGAGIFEAMTHVGEDFVTVISGEVEIVLDSIERHRLHTGDSMTFPSTRPHSFHNPGDEPCHLILVNTPPTF